MDFNDNQNFNDIRRFIHVARGHESRTQWKGQGLRWMFHSQKSKPDRGTTKDNQFIGTQRFICIIPFSQDAEAQRAQRCLSYIQSTQTNSDSLYQGKKKNCKNRTKDDGVDCLGCLKSQFQCPVNRSMRSMGRERRKREGK